MKALEEKILTEGKVYPGGVLKVGSFLNHQIDVPFMKKIGKEFYDLFHGEQITKILTIETSGIAIAVVCAAEFDVPVLFAKKHQTKNLTNDCYVAHIHSYTHGTDHDVTVSREYLLPTDKVLLIDDFLANGEALAGLVALCRQAGAEVVGAGIAIEKAYQPGGQRIRDLGIRVESLARIRSMDLSSGIQFC